MSRGCRNYPEAARIIVAGLRYELLNSFVTWPRKAKQLSGLWRMKATYTINVLWKNLHLHELYISRSMFELRRSIFRTPQTMTSLGTVGASSQLPDSPDHVSGPIPDNIHVEDISITSSTYPLNPTLASNPMQPCLIIAVLGGLAVFLSFAMYLSWGIWTGDYPGGAQQAEYIAAIFGIPIGIVGYKHSGHCQCSVWRSRNAVTDDTGERHED